MTGVKLFSAMVICTILAVIGCSKPVASHAESSVSTLPAPNYPEAKLEIEKPGVRKCTVAVDFSGWPDSPGWNRMACGIEQIYYDGRIEYLGHGAKGDRYRITVREPYPEGEGSTTENVPVAFDTEVEFSGGTLKVLEVSGVSFTLKS